MPDSQEILNDFFVFRGEKPRPELESTRAAIPLSYAAVELLAQLGVALGFATLSGLNLYLTTLVAGLAVRFHWIDLAERYHGLGVLGNWWVIGIAGGMFLVEFFADKIPWVDSAWDAVHTVIRPVGGVLLALAALGQVDPTMQVIAGLCAGTAALTTHGAKAGTRALLNLSPEPVTNTTASVAEDGVVLGGMGLMAAAPALSLVVFALMVICAGWFCFWLWKKIKGLRRNRLAPA